MKKAILIFITSILTVVPAMAAESESEANEAMVETTGSESGVNVATESPSGNSAMYALSAALVMGLAALGGAFAQGKIGASAMDGIARNPQAQQNMFVSMIIGLVLIESLVIYALVISFLLVGKIA